MLHEDDGAESVPETQVVLTQINNAQRDDVSTSPRNGRGFLRRPTTPGLSLDHGFAWTKARLPKHNFRLKGVTTAHGNENRSVHAHDKSVTGCSDPILTFQIPPDHTTPIPAKSGLCKDVEPTPQECGEIFKGLNLMPLLPADLSSKAKPTFTMEKSSSCGKSSSEESTMQKFPNTADHNSTDDAQNPHSPASTMQLVASNCFSGKFPSTISRISTSKVVEQELNAVGKPPMNAAQESLTAQDASHANEDGIQLSSTSQNGPSMLENGPRNVPVSAPVKGALAKEMIMARSDFLASSLKQPAPKRKLGSDRINFEQKLKSSSLSHEPQSLVTDEPKIQQTLSSGLSCGFDTIGSLSDTIKSQHEESERLRDNLTSLTEQRDHFKKKVEAMKLEFASTNTNQEFQAQKICRLKNSKDKLIKKIEETREELQRVKSSLQTLKVQNENFSKIERPQLQTQCDALKKSLEYANELHAKLDIEHQQTIRDNNLLVERYKDQEKWLEEHAGLLAEERDRSSRLEHEVMKKTSMIKNFQRLMEKIDNGVVQGFFNTDSSMKNMLSNHKDATVASDQISKRIDVGASQVISAVRSLEEKLHQVSSNVGETLDAIFQNQDVIGAKHKQSIIVVLGQICDGFARIEAGQALEEELNVLKISKASLEAQCATKEAIITSLNQQGDEMRRQIKDLEYQYGMSGEMKKFIEQLQQHQQNFSHSVSLISSTHDQMKQLNHDHEEVLYKRLDENQRENEKRRQEQLEESNTRYQVLEQAKEAREAALQRDYAKSQAQLNESKQQCDRERAVAEGHLAVAENAKAEVDRLYEKVQDDLTHHKNSEHESKTKIEKLTNELVEAQKTIAIQEEKLEVLRLEQGTIKRFLSNKIDSIQNQDEIIKTLQKQLVAAQNLRTPATNRTEQVDQTTQTSSMARLESRGGSEEAPECSCRNAHRQASKGGMTSLHRQLFHQSDHGDKDILGESNDPLTSKLRTESCVIKPSTLTLKMTNLDQTTAPSLFRAAWSRNTLFSSVPNTSTPLTPTHRPSQFSPIDGGRKYINTLVSPITPLNYSQDVPGGTVNENMRAQKDPTTPCPKPRTVPHLQDSNLQCNSLLLKPVQVSVQDIQMAAATGSQSKNRWKGITKLGDTSSVQPPDKTYYQSGVSDSRISEGTVQNDEQAQHRNEDDSTTNLKLEYQQVPSGKRRLPNLDNGAKRQPAKRAKLGDMNHPSKKQPRGPDGKFKRKLCEPTSESQNIGTARNDEPSRLPNK